MTDRDYVEEILNQLRGRPTKIVKIDRSGSSREKTLTVLFIDESDQSYFCVQQDSSAYGGLGLRFKFTFSKESAVSDIMFKETGYSSWIGNVWFHESFRADICGSPCLREGQYLQIGVAEFL